jgi:endonuclease G, mitochondrial
MKIINICLWVIFAAFSASSGFCQLPLEYFLPSDGQKGLIVRHFSYTLKFNNQYKQAEWVIYFLNKGRLKGTFASDNKFIPDPDIKTGQAQVSDYSGSGYEIGQMAAPGDMKWSKMSASECFLLSSVSPQKSALKRGPWDALEKKVRKWAEENEEIYVVSGPVLKGDLTTIGSGKVAAPKYFFKVILDIKEPDMKGIGFIFPNGKSGKPLEEYAVSIDSVEDATGINFFPNIPDQLENKLESTVEISKWFGDNVAADSTGKNITSMTMKSGTTSSHQTKTGKIYAPAVMCLGVGKDGKRCPRMTTNENGFCWEHQDQAKLQKK